MSRAGPSASRLPWLIRQTDLVALLPRRAAEWAAGMGSFVVRDTEAGESSRFEEAILWHPGRATDPGLVWLRESLLAAVGDGQAEPPAPLERPRTIRRSYDVYVKKLLPWRLTGRTP